MKKNIDLIFALALSFIIVGCASGTVLVTGTQRAAINPETVVIYTEAPAKYEVIGIVNASSDATGIAQTDLNYAIAELKKQAAKIGANGIILQNIFSSNNGGVFVGNVYVSETSQNVSGKAIYVSDDEN
nr:hypothetical protein [Treponema sp.]